MFSAGTVAVITAATGHEKLVNCLRSVQRQTYRHVQHIVVVDGPEWPERVHEAIFQAEPSPRPVHVVQLPYPTGKNNFGGHRIYGALPYLLNTEFMSYLDEDNWIDPDHVESLVSAIRNTAARWAFSLRKIYDASGTLITHDNCESLGNLHPVFHNENLFHIDTNCYLLHREVAVQCSPLWYRRGRWPGGKPGPDTLVCQMLLKRHPQACCSRKYTLNYTVGSQSGSVRAEFFLRGNQVMRERYPRGLPWEQPTTGDSTRPQSE
jgi:hypothetical protein